MYKMSIKKQFLIIIMVTIIPFIVVPWWGYFYVEEVMEEQLLLQSRQNLEQITRNLEQVFNSVIGASNAITMDEEIVNGLEGEFKNLEQLKRVSKKISNINAAQLYSYNAEIYLYSAEGKEYLATKYSIPELNINNHVQDEREYWIRQALTKGSKFTWYAFREEYISKQIEDKPVIGIARNILDKSGKIIGGLGIELYKDRNIDAILSCDNEFPSTERYLVDEEGNIVISSIDYNEQEVFYSKEWFQNYKKHAGDEKDQVIHIKHLSKSPWSVVQIIPYKEMVRKLAYYRNVIIIVNIVFLIILMWFDFISITRITQSIVKLKDAMKEVKEGDFITIPIFRNNQEMEQLSRGFNIMSTRLSKLFEENKRIFEEKQRTRLDVLQAQIQPHFLFNTLSGIKWLCIMEGAKKAEEMLVSLGFILEYSLSKNRDIITLAEEIKCLEHYVTLQKMRYGEIFEIKCEIEKELEGLQVPILFLQPLVENSIIHGFYEKEDIGHIIIRARIIDEWIQLQVEDDGIGIDLVKIEGLVSNIDKSSSIGVKNVIERVNIYYGKGSSTKFERGIMGGTLVTIKWKEKREDETNYC